MRRHLACFLVLILVGAAVNLLVAVQFLHSRLSQPRTYTELWRGADAAARGWPGPTPHNRSWPAPDYWWIHRSFGYTMIDVRKDLPSDERIVMDMQFMGWPFPALKMQHMWWPDMQPWQTSQEPDPAMQLCWQGVLLNPLIFAGALWLAFMGLPSFWLVVRRLHRIRRRMCPACAYPVGTAKNCSECGSPLPDKLQAAASPGTVQPS